MREMQVYDAMRSPVITTAPWVRLPQVRRLMLDHEIHRLPVVRGDELVGMITMSDLRNAFPSDVAPCPEVSRRVAQVAAEAIMRRDVVTIAPEQTLAEALRQMLAHHISGLPVLDHGRLIGMLTKSDLCRALLQHDRALAVPSLGVFQHAALSDKRIARAVGQ